MESAAVEIVTGIEIVLAVSNPEEELEPNETVGKVGVATEALIEIEIVVTLDWFLLFAVIV